MPAQTMPTSPLAPTTTSPIVQGAINPEGRQWSYSTMLLRNKAPQNEAVVPVEFFELEGITAGSGVKSWTLRVPWLRSNRPRRRCRDDVISSIRTAQPRSTGNLVLPESDDLDAVYFGGLMKIAEPAFVSGESGNIEALEGDGLFRITHDSTPDSPRVLQQLQTNSPARQNETLSDQKVAPEVALCDTAEVDQNFQPQHHPPPPPPPPARDATTKQSGTHHSYFLATTTHLEPKNNNKVFRNRSWISTSSRESEGRRRNRRRHEFDDDSLLDFDEAEWTPQDSAYGAAIPVCGWVPKRLRQGIEATLIAFTVFALVYLVVTTSISISEGKSSGKHLSDYSNSGAKVYDSSLKFDDDWYIEVSQYKNDDDYYKNNGGARGKDGNHGN